MTVPGNGSMWKGAGVALLVALVSALTSVIVASMQIQSKANAIQLELTGIKDTLKERGPYIERIIKAEGLITDLTRQVGELRVTMSEINGRVERNSERIDERLRQIERDNRRGDRNLFPQPRPTPN
jgi:hypothetical protein